MSTRAGWGWALFLVVVFGALMTLRLGQPGFLDYEGRYADVASEMLESRDWVTPRLDHTLFLNKPPLLYWATAVAFHALGPSEWARLISILAAMVALLATCRLGARLHGEPAGLAGGLCLATLVGFALEARKLRPDMIMTAAIVVAVLCWVRAEEARDERRRAAWLVGLWGAVGVGIMAKGLVAAVVAGIPIGATALRDHGWRAVGRVRPGLGLAVLGALVLPWHVLVSERHPGFAWDYVVNQHLLFFLDKKLPRDSEGLGLAPFWGAFAGRAFPWLLLVPLAVREGMRGLRPGATPPASGTGLLLAWAGGLMLFFSAAPSRLEHYAVPALPAVALLGARGWERLRAGEGGRLAWAAYALVALALIAFGVGVLTRGPSALSHARWAADAPALRDLMLPAATVLIGEGLVLAAAALVRHPYGLAAGLMASACGLIPIVVAAETALEPLLSWRPVAALIRARTPAGTAIVFEAPEEYQLVGGLAFYARQPIGLLEPPGFVAPTYLAGRLGDVFLARPEFERRWAGAELMVLVSNLQRWRATPDGIAPEPSYVLGRSGARWVLTNRPPG